MHMQKEGPCSTQRPAYTVSHIKGNNVGPPCVCACDLDGIVHGLSAAAVQECGHSRGEEGEPLAFCCTWTLPPCWLPSSLLASELVPLLHTTMTASLYAM